MCFRGGEANRMAASVWGSKVSKSISIPFFLVDEQKKEQEEAARADGSQVSELAIP